MCSSRLIAYDCTPRFLFPNSLSMFQLFPCLLTMRNVISFRRHPTLTGSVEMLPCGQVDTITSKYNGPISNVRPPLFSLVLPFHDWNKEWLSLCSYAPSSAPSHWQTTAPRKLHTNPLKKSKICKDKKCILNQIRKTNSFPQRSMKIIALTFC